MDQNSKTVRNSAYLERAGDIFEENEARFHVRCTECDAVIVRDMPARTYVYAAPAVTEHWDKVHP